MSNPIYESQDGGIMSALKSIKQNPMQFIMQRNFSVPQNIINDPNAIIQHLMNTGQVSQQKYNNIMRMMGQFK